MLLYHGYLQLLYASWAGHFAVPVKSRNISNGLELRACSQDLDTNYARRRRF
jgi:hypothetical protein